MSAIAVFETITENNFSPERYVKAHPEVLTSGLAPRRHYEEFGRAQDYKQVTHVLHGPRQTPRPV